MPFKNMSGENKELQIQKYYHHKEIFNLQDNKFLLLYENYLLNSNDYILECSVKINNKNIYPYRFITYYSKDTLKELLRSIQLFLGYNNFDNIRINLYILKKIISANKTNIRNISGLAVGCDFRDDIFQSRLKLYIRIGEENYELFNYIFELYKQQTNILDISKYIIKNNMLFGIDFGFDGSTRIKIYPSFKDYEFKNTAIRKIVESLFSSYIISYMLLSSQTNITFNINGKKRILHFGFKNHLDLFLQDLDADIFKKILIRIGLFEQCFIGIYEEDLEEKRLQNINFYYS